MDFNNKNNMLSQITRVLVIIGGLNWGLVGLGMLLGSASNWNVVAMIFGTWPMLLGLVYLLVGLSAVYMVVPRR